MQKKTDSNSPDAASLTFEQAMARLQAIVDRIESGQVGLEESMQQYAEGVGLVERCREILERCEQRVEELSVQVDRASKPGKERG